MHERTLIETRPQKRPINPITKTWALLLALCTSPTFILYAYLGDPGRGQAAWVSAGSIGLAVRFLWDLRERVWFWITIVAIVGAHVPLILLIAWPLKQLSYIALLPLGFLDFLIAYGLIRLVEIVIQRRS